MTENNETYRTVEIIIPENISKERLDKFLGQNPELEMTRSKVQKLIEDGLIMVDGRPAQHNHKLNGGETVVIKIPPPPETDIIAEDIPLDIVFEDDHLLVVNKPAGMVTHPAIGHFSGTLVNAVLKYSESLSGLQGMERAGVVHRLDKDTSGLIMIAKNDRIHLALQKQLKDHKIKKIYQAVVCGHMKEHFGTIDLPIGRSIKDRKRMAVTNLRSRPALTEYRLLERFKLYDYVEIHLKTGRTHQIRVHFSHLGHPVFGDAEYGGRLKWHKGVYSTDKVLAQKALELMPRQALHALSLEFTHPETGKIISLTSELPGDFRSLLEFLRNWQ
ncbi:MAG: RNA pseudouridine synthase [candidate division Zixibacteria bacterium HGW-Zixibacteria-1]|nr:MAG: RNA pseudouridine synthase [candidate division Zixibacteria bacterium HGW-Zixibacteria-1]